MTMKSADDLIVQTEMEKLGKKIEINTNKPPENTELPPPDLKEAAKAAEQQDDHVDNQETPELKAEDKPKNQEKVESEAKDLSSDEIDDYGNPVSKGKTYTEEQLNMIVRDRLARDRLSRGQPQATPQQQQQIQDAAKDFKADPESSEGWEQQLESFIEKTIAKAQHKGQKEEWQRKEQEVQSQFEDKFTRGIGRYDDFRKVVAEKPITNSMMMATRSMQDPAAFIYAACKQHPEEIKRISSIPDAVTQIAEIGRLEERMKKVKTITRTPAPAKKVSGDMSDNMPKQDIDRLIADHAKTKIMYRR